MLAFYVLQRCQSGRMCLSRKQVNRNVPAVQIRLSAPNKCRKAFVRRGADSHEVFRLSVPEAIANAMVFFDVKKYLQSILNLCII